MYIYTYNYYIYIYMYIYPYGSKHFLRRYLTSQIIPQTLPKKVLGSIGYIYIPSWLHDISAESPLSPLQVYWHSAAGQGGRPQGRENWSLGTTFIGIERPEKIWFLVCFCWDRMGIERVCELDFPAFFDKSSRFMGLNGPFSIANC